MFLNIALNVVARAFTGQQVATPGVVAQGGKSVSDDSAEFAGDEDFHG
jgi:hypothetical protein